ncbi:hypothetical protein MKUB_54110 [Mycobacterium kubicae]|uniref:Uncharacterized protein n=1 Tax=Mycobacterium kubicae TaxID=120959 RepID=A0ABQ1BW69_9MYCO|nr:hypothetical protein MKUB_54110 [Mycobacterium kubicae]
MLKPLTLILCGLKVGIADLPLPALALYPARIKPKSPLDMSRELIVSPEDAVQSFAAPFAFHRRAELSQTLPLGESLSVVRDFRGNVSAPEVDVWAFGIPQFDFFNAGRVFVSWRGAAKPVHEQANE